MFQDNPLDPGFSLFEEEDKIIYEDGESNSGIIFGITCVASFSISFEAIGGSVDPSIWTDVNLVIFRNNELVIDEGARIFAGTQAGSVFERITVGLGDSEACNLLVYIEFVKAPDSGGVDLECYFNATD